MVDSADRNAIAAVVASGSGGADEADVEVVAVKGETDSLVYPNMHFAECSLYEIECGAAKLRGERLSTQLPLFL